MTWSRRRFLRTGLALPAVALGCRREVVAAKLPARVVGDVVRALPTMEGAGVRLSRALGSRALSMFDPFLLLDEIHSDRPEDYAAGFPTHPHRGFETVTYMLHGAMEHRDSVGNHGRLGPGSVQWMTAGRGIVHSEMPRQDRGLLWGFQLWVNLPAARKMTAPRYQDIAPARVPEWTSPEGARVRILAGTHGAHTGPVEGIVTAPELLDVALPQRVLFEHALPPTHNAFLYCIEGGLVAGDEARPVARGEVATLPAPGGGGVSPLRVRALAAGARFLFFAARPLREPVARYGPFVMSTDAEIRQAVEDYRSGRLIGG